MGKLWSGNKPRNPSLKIWASDCNDSGQSVLTITASGSTVRRSNFAEHSGKVVSQVSSAHADADSRRNNREISVFDFIVK